MNTFSLKTRILLLDITSWVLLILLAILCKLCHDLALHHAGYEAISAVGLLVYAVLLISLCIWRYLTFCKSLEDTTLRVYKDLTNVNSVSVDGKEIKYDNNVGIQRVCQETIDQMNTISTEQNRKVGDMVILLDNIAETAVKINDIQKQLPLSCWNQTDHVKYLAVLQLCGLTFFIAIGCLLLLDQ